MRPSISGIAVFGTSANGATSFGQAAGVATSTPSGNVTTAAASFLRI